MKKLDRRQWLRTAGIGGALSFLGSGSALAETAFQPGPAAARKTTDELIRLSSNENPYGPSQKVRKAISNAFDLACRYPYGYQQELREAIGKKHGVPADHILLAAGSTEGLKVAGMVYGGDGGEVIAAEPTYLSLLNYAEEMGGHIHMVPVDKDLGHDLDEMEKRITNKTGLVFVCNPNNPTGTLLPAEKMRDFCHTISQRTMVFADEAYFDYITEPNYPSMVELVLEGANVIVSRTFSKVFGLAGIRIGYLIARPDIISRLNHFTMGGASVPAIMAALEALKDEEFYRFSIEQNAKSKKIIYQALDDLRLRYIPSHSNFVFFHTGRDISKVNAAMQKEGIAVGRPFPPLTDWCRISTGTIEETEAFAKALQKVMNA